MKDKLIFAIEQNDGLFPPVITRCYTRKCPHDEFSLDVLDVDWAKTFNSVYESMIYYAIRGIPAFLIPQKDSYSTRYFIPEHEFKTIESKYESNGIILN